MTTLATYGVILSLLFGAFMAFMTFGEFKQHALSCYSRDSALAKGDAETVVTTGTLSVIPVGVRCDYQSSDGERYTVQPPPLLTAGWLAWLGLGVASVGYLTRRRPAGR